MSGNVLQGSIAAAALNIGTRGPCSDADGEKNMSPIYVRDKNCGIETGILCPGSERPCPANLHTGRNGDMTYFGPGAGAGPPLDSPTATASGFQIEEVTWATTGSSSASLAESSSGATGIGSNLLHQSSKSTRGLSGVDAMMPLGIERDGAEPPSWSANSWLAGGNTSLSSSRDANQF